MRKGMSLKKERTEGRLEGKNEVLQKLKEYLELLDRELVREAANASFDPET